MDFLFVPGTSAAEVLGRNVVSQRPRTTLITLSRRQNHLAGFLAKLGAGGSITLPIGDILFVAHGLETGEYYIPLSPSSPAPADFEEADRREYSQRGSHSGGTRYAIRRRTIEHDHGSTAGVQYRAGTPVHRETSNGDDPYRGVAEHGGPAPLRRVPWHSRRMGGVPGPQVHVESADSSLTSRADLLAAFDTASPAIHLSGRHSDTNRRLGQLGPNRNSPVSSQMETELRHAG